MIFETVTGGAFCSGAFGRWDGFMGTGRQVGNQTGETLGGWEGAGNAMQGGLSAPACWRRSRGVVKRGESEAAA